MSVFNQQKIIIFLLGIATIMAGVVTWRAGQIASTAAFDDRQSVGQTIEQEQQDLQIGLRTVSDAADYVRYAADYAEAAALDLTALELAVLSANELADVAKDDADSLRRLASARGALSGLFGQNSLYADLAVPTPEPKSFNFDEHLEQVAAEVTTGIDSAGRLDPDHWAQKADDLRSMVRNLRVATFVLIVSVVFYTIGQMTDRQRTRTTATAGGFAIFMVTLIVTFSTTWST